MSLQTIIVSSSTQSQQKCLAVYFMLVKRPCLQSSAVGMIQFVEDDGSIEVIFMKKCEKGLRYKWSTPDIISKLSASAFTAKLLAITIQTGRV